MLEVKDFRALENMVLVVYSRARRYCGSRARASWTVMFGVGSVGMRVRSETDSWNCREDQDIRDALSAECLGIITKESRNV